MPYLLPRSKASYPPRSSSRKPSSKRRTRDDRSKSTRSSLLISVIYQSSFVAAIGFLTVLLVVSAYGIGGQAAMRGAVGRGNIVVLAAAYTAVVSCYVDTLSNQLVAHPIGCNIGYAGLES
jgi:hypothetical protein